jgi:hypothetical protein
MHDRIMASLQPVPNKIHALVRGVLFARGNKHNNNPEQWHHVHGSFWQTTLEGNSHPDISVVSGVVGY